MNMMTFLIIASVLVVVGSLGFGIAAMAHYAMVWHRTSAQWMSMRVAFQALVSCLSSWSCQPASLFALPQTVRLWRGYVFRPGRELGSWCRRPRGPRLDGGAAMVTREDGPVVTSRLHVRREGSGSAR